MSVNVHERIRLLERRIELLEQERAPPARLTTLERVIRAVSQATDVSRAEMMSPTRAAHVCDARRMCWLLLRREGWTLTRIGTAFMRSHASVIHALRKRAPAELLARAERLLEGD